MKAAVIVETRDVINGRGLVGIIEAHLQYLPGWPVIVFGNAQNIVNVKQNLPEATFIDLQDFFNRPMYKLTEAEYNQLLTSRWFWEQLPEKVLIFQHDSGILREGIEEFMEWDYVGAPWSFSHHGGNGGLSLRTRDVMLSVIDRFPYRNPAHGNEDVYYSGSPSPKQPSRIEMVGGNLAPREVCSRFSCEAIFELGTFGYHAIDKWLTPEQVRQIKQPGWVKVK